MSFVRFFRTGLQTWHGWRTGCSFTRRESETSSSSLDSASITTGYRWKRRYSSRLFYRLLKIRDIIERSFNVQKKPYRSAQQASVHRPPVGLNGASTWKSSIQVFLWYVWFPKSVFIMIQCESSICIYICFDHVFIKNSQSSGPLNQRSRHVCWVAPKMTTVWQEQNKKGKKDLLMWEESIYTVVLLALWGTHDNLETVVSASTTGSTWKLICQLSSHAHCCCFCNFSFQHQCCF